MRDKGKLTVRSFELTAYFCSFALYVYDGIYFPNFFYSLDCSKPLSLSEKSTKIQNKWRNKLYTLNTYSARYFVEELTPQT